MHILNNIIWDVSPTIFESGNFELRYYSLFFILSFFVGYFGVKLIYKNENIPTDEIDPGIAWVAVGGILGARIAHCLFYDWAYYQDNLLEIILPIRLEPEFHFAGYQGLASHGGVAGVLITLFIYKFYTYKKSFLWLIDRVAVPTGFIGALIRLGNLMNSEIYGKQTDLPWGFVFVRNGDTYASHPTQIYEALCYILISIILIVLYKNHRVRNSKGFLSGIFLILIFTTRFFIEFFKENQAAFEDDMFLNMGQILSIPAVLAGIGLLIYSTKLYYKKSR